MARNVLGANTHVLGLKLPEQVWKALEEKAAREYRTPQEVVRSLLVAQLREEGALS